ncbi:hypothetical protein [uncultured Rubinisphaera sp.]|uniref:hypothetical protein n=1 Tax=uncultured Rubinisphaera sp. TaxID=1678686 RepID=UPI0030DCAC29
MTKFHRDGYWRTSKNGVQHWVSSTTVTRNDFSHYSYGSNSQIYPDLPSPDLFLEKYPEFIKTKSTAACFVKPNAKCPVCGENVFYYQNEHGSRVFFDELGPPWPKHPCMDLQLLSSTHTEAQLGLTFSIRSQQNVVEIVEWQRGNETDFESEFISKYNARPWQLATLIRRIKAGRFVFIVLKLLKNERVTTKYISCKSLPKCCKRGLVLAIGRRKISFINSITLEPVEVSIKQYRGAKPFMEAMDEADIVNK